MRLRVFRLPVTVHVEVEVMSTENVDADRAVASIYAGDYRRQIIETTGKHEGDPVRVREVTVGEYPTLIKELTR